jgi:putative endonuclease
MVDGAWWLYLIECKGGSIYTGIALDVDARYRMHCAGKGAAYTRANPPVRILARVQFPSRRLAAQAECEMKRRPAAAKWRWVASLTEPAPPLPRG